MNGQVIALADELSRSQDAAAFGSRQNIPELTQNRVHESAIQNAKGFIPATFTDLLIVGKKVHSEKRTKETNTMKMAA